MSQKFLQNHSRVLNNTLSQLDNFYNPIGSKVNVYKFRKVSGSIYLTRYGEVPINTKSETYNQNFQVYTGKEPIVVVWDNSFKAIGDKQTNKITKNYKVGDYETCYLVNALDVSNETTSKNLYGKEYTMTMLKYNLTLQSNTWIPNEDDMRDYLYLILDKKSQSYKWLEITNITPIYNEETNNLQYCEINFESINDKYTQTGKTILDFIQFGAIGEGYAFPKETHLANGDIVVDIDIRYLDDMGCNTLQLDFTSGAALSSVFVIGRRKSKKIDDYTFEVDKPHLLWLYDTQPPIISKFFYNQPNLNSYIGVKFQPTKEGIWKSYKDAYKGNNRIGEYNILNTKEVLTGLLHNQSTIRSTNSGINTHTNWEMNKNFNFNFGNQIEYDTNPYCLPELNWTKQCNYVDFLNVNALINFATDVFDYDYRETKKWKLTDTLGILGGLVNIAVGGLDIGWTSSNILSQVPNDLNLIIPCISYEDGMLALDSNAPLPLDVFYDDKSQKVLPTSTNVLTSWRFRLTDRVIDTSQVREGAEIGKGGNGIWDLKYVGQKQFEDGTYINLDKTPFRIKLSTTTPATPSDDSFEFIVDYIDFKVVASCDYRISAYDNANEPVYYSISETNGKARGDIRIWGNTTKFNYYDKFNVEGEIIFPNYDNPPPPSDDLVGFELPLNDEFCKILKQKSFFNYKEENKSGSTGTGGGWYSTIKTYTPKNNNTGVNLTFTINKYTAYGGSIKDTDLELYNENLKEDTYKFDFSQLGDNQTTKLSTITINKNDLNWVDVKRIVITFYNGEETEIPYQDGSVDYNEEEIIKYYGDSIATIVYKDKLLGFGNRTNKVYNWYYQKTITSSTYTITKRSNGFILDILVNWKDGFMKFEKNDNLIWNAEDRTIDGEIIKKDLSKDLWDIKIIKSIKAFY